MVHSNNRVQFGNKNRMRMISMKWYENYYFQDIFSSEKTKYKKYICMMLLMLCKVWERVSTHTTNTHKLKILIIYKGWVGSGRER